MKAGAAAVAILPPIGRCVDVLISGFSHIIRSLSCCGNGILRRGHFLQKRFFDDLLNIYVDNIYQR